MLLGRSIQRGPQIELFPKHEEVAASCRSRNAAQFGNSLGRVPAGPIRPTGHCSGQGASTEPIKDKHLRRRESPGNAGGSPGYISSGFVSVGIAFPKPVLNGEWLSRRATLRSLLNPMPGFIRQSGRRPRQLADCQSKWAEAVVELIEDYFVEEREWPSRPVSMLCARVAFRRDQRCREAVA